MARTGRRNGRDRNSGSTQSDAERIIDAALSLVPTNGWQGTSLAAIAAEAGLPILQVYRIFRSKQAILRAFFRRIDQIVLAELPPAEADERPRDRLFDLMMRRFDALRPYKPALEVLRYELVRDPVSGLCAGAALLRSIRWMLEAADIPTGGLRGAVAVRLACAAYLSTMRVWQGDQSPDLGRTMAALDARLRRVESWFRQARSPASDGEAISA